MLKNAEKYCKTVINVRQTEVAMVVVMIPMYCGWYKFCKSPHPGCGEGLAELLGKQARMVRMREQLGAREAFKAVLLLREVLILLKHHRLLRTSSKRCEVSMLLCWN